MDDPLLYGMKQTEGSILNVLIYQVFRDFSFNPIDDDRFAILRETENTLTSPSTERRSYLVPSLRNQSFMSCCESSVLEGVSAGQPDRAVIQGSSLWVLGEVTPLLMQKLLYYIQGLSLALHDHGKPVIIDGVEREIPEHLVYTWINRTMNPGLTGFRENRPKP